MRMKRVKVEEGAENEFERLPDEVVIEILNKLVHFKHIIRCSSVCKRFGSFIYHIRTMFISGPTCNPNNMRKFSELRSIHIDMDEALPVPEQSPGVFVKYKAVFSSHIDVVVFVIASRLQGAPNVGGLYYDEVVLDFVRDSLSISLVMHAVARLLVSRLPVLDQLLMDTSLSKFYLGKVEIAKLRTATTANNSDPPTDEIFAAKIFHDRLELPASGIVMPHAYIAVVRPEGGEEIVMEKDLGLMLGSLGAKYEDDGDHNKDHGREDETGKIIDEVVNVVRKKMASDPNGDLVTLHQSISPKIVS